MKYEISYDEDGPLATRIYLGRKDARGNDVDSNFCMRVFPQFCHEKYPKSNHIDIDKLCIGFTGEVAKDKVLEIQNIWSGFLLSMRHLQERIAILTGSSLPTCKSE